MKYKVSLSVFFIRQFSCTLTPLHVLFIASKLDWFHSIVALIFNNYIYLYFHFMQLCVCSLQRFRRVCPVCVCEHNKMQKYGPTKHYIKNKHIEQSVATLEITDIKGQLCILYILSGSDFCASKCFFTGVMVISLFMTCVNEHKNGLRSLINYRTLNVLLAEFGSVEYSLNVK